MTTALPDPPIGPEVDCTALASFMLNTERLLASELVAGSTHTVIGAALLLWCRAWKQRPAASLPDDERVLAGFAKLPLSRFRKLREKVLHGFVKCADGRLYHPVLAAEAIGAWQNRKRILNQVESEKKKKLALRAAKKAQKSAISSQSVPGDSGGTNPGQTPPPPPSPPPPSAPLLLPPHTPLITTPHLPPTSSSSSGHAPFGARDEDDDLSIEFESFWKLYPRKVNRRRAYSAYVVARKTATFEQLIAAARRYAAENSGKKLYHVSRPENWLGDQRWFDDPENATIEPNGSGELMLPGSPAHWRHRMQLWFDEERGGPIRARWKWGPAPGEPGCQVPPEVLMEFKMEE
jgi:hypothetical protein